MILLLSVRMLDGRFHGLAANGEQPNWPPSCFRLFQAIVAGNARGDSIPLDVIEALKWLESLSPPVVIVPASKAGRVTLTYVLNNAEGRSRTQKFLRPTLLNGDRLIEFAWQYDPSEGMAQKCAHVLLEAVRHIRAFGWGIDLAIGHGVIREHLPEPSESRFRFFPREQPEASGIEIRVPIIGTMDSLMECFRQYLGRFESRNSTLLESGGPLYQPWPYTAGIPRPHAVFKLLNDEFDTTRYPHAMLAHIAAVVRHSAIECMKIAANAPTWIPQEQRPDWISRFVRGRNDPPREPHQQISYIPLPSIGHEHADAMIRNVMLIAPIGCERELHHVAAKLNSVTLEFKDAADDCETDVRARELLPRSLQQFNPPRGKFIDTHYVGRSKVWQSVTPVILDEHIDKRTWDANVGQTIKRRDPEDFKRLIILALRRAGIKTPCSFTWQTLAYYKNCLSAHRYDRNKRFKYVLPKRLDGKTTVNLRLTFEHEVPGPLTLGAGRHCGFGLMAAVND